MRAMMILGLVTVVLSSVGCGVTAPVVPPTGAVFTQFTAPLDTDMDKTQIADMKRGTSSVVAILGLVSSGDAGINAAAEDANIATIYHVDYEFTNILFGIFQKYTTVVYGQ